MVGERLLAPPDVGTHALLPAVEVLPLFLVGVERPVVVVAGAIVDLRVTLAGVKLELPPATVLNALEFLPREVLVVAVVDSTDVDEHDRGEVQLLQDRVGARPGVGPRVVERQQQRPRGQIDGRLVDEVEEGLQVDRLVAGMVDLRHLLGEVVGANAVRGVGGVREVALAADPVVEQNRDRGPVRRELGPHLLFLRREGHGRCRGWRAGGGRWDFVVGAPASDAPETRPARQDCECCRRCSHGMSTVTLIKLCAALLVASSAVVTDASAAGRVPDRPAIKVVRMAADSLVARHRAMPKGGWAWRSAIQAPHHQTDRDVGAASIGEGLLAAYAVTHDPRYKQAAVKAGDYLLGVAEPAAGGLRWPDWADPSGRRSTTHFTSFDDGAAGISDYLWKLFDVTRAQRFRTGALKGMRWLIARAEGPDCPQVSCRW